MLRKQLIALITTLPFVSPASVQASTGPSGFYIPTAITSMFSITSLGEFVGAILTFLYIISGVIFFIQIVVAGFQWILSGGDSSNTDNAKARIVSAFVGLSIVALAYAAVVLIEYFFGITIISDTARIPLPFTK